MWSADSSDDSSDVSSVRSLKPEQIRSSYPLMQSCPSNWSTAWRPTLTLKLPGDVAPVCQKFRSGSQWSGRLGKLVQEQGV